MPTTFLHSSDHSLHMALPNRTYKLAKPFGNNNIKLACYLIEQAKEDAPEIINECHISAEVQHAVKDYIDSAMMAYAYYLAGCPSYTEAEVHSRLAKITGVIRNDKPMPMSLSLSLADRSDATIAEPLGQAAARWVVEAVDKVADRYKALPSDEARVEALAEFINVQRAKAAKTR